MLINLYIENIAVIEKSNINFKNGLNILTGETGAGKSIVIDAISAILGHRTSKEMIRTGSDKAFVSATFENINDETAKKLSELGYDLDDDTLIISREINSNGKTSCRINSRPATVSVLKEIGLNLINIHGQHESYELFSPETHIDYIDATGSYVDLKDEYKKEYSQLKKIEKQIDSLNIDETNRLQDIDLLSYQVNELEEANIEIGEEETLSEERMILQNSEKLTSNLQKALLYAEGDGDSEGAVSLLDNLCATVNKCADLNPNLQELSEKLNDVYYNFQDCVSEVSNALDDIDSDSYRLNDIEERLDLLYKLKRKYGQTEEMLEFLENARQKLNELTQLDINKENLEKEYNTQLSKTMKLAKELSESRKKTGEQFVANVQKELVFLDMPNVKFTVSYEQIPLSSNGQDKMELLVSANLGEEPKPVAKIASGGELSRIMLAIKTVLAENDIIDTLIFDEIDAGISGSAAQKVGLKLKEVSLSRQVLCVTHQAQIAALANEHLFIKKETKENKTFTNITSLDFEGRKHELARIIDGVNITETALAHAEQLLKNN
ncbi:MAG: DNA repair protein RecN [Ruminococcus sp.]|nr:DNA repair protein RecN [Ruminococcus sp.]